MKNMRWFLSTFLFLYFGSSAEAQVTNLTVNGVSSNFTMVQGDSCWWEYNLPIGGTADGEIWIDLNSNGIIDPSTDKQLFGDLTQTDGQYSNVGGPGDMDSTADGHIFFGVPNLGFAPASHIFKFTNNGVGQTIAGTVTVLTSPAFTISGMVTPPPLINPQNIIVTASCEGAFWMALTNDSGNYIINFNSSASNQEMGISVMDEFPPYIVGDTRLTMTNSYLGINFVFAQPAAKIVGYLKGEDNQILDNVDIYCVPQSGSGSHKLYTTDTNGFFEFGFSLSEINSAPLWELSAGSDGVSPNYFPPRSGSISLHQYDSLNIDLIAFIANDTITGRITVDGGAPNNQSFRIYAHAPDRGQTETTTDPITGNFTLHVTSNIYNYQPGLDNLPNVYGYDWSNVQMHPGDTNIVLNVETIAWQPQTSNTYNSLRSISFVNSNTGWVAGSNGIVLKTTNAGNTWSSQTTNTLNTINGIFFISPSTGWFVGNGGIIKKTTNGGIEWTSQNSTTADDLQAVQFIDANIGWAVGGSTNSGIILKTTNGGTTWSPQNSMYNQHLYSIYMVNANVGWAGGEYGIVKTTDGGSTWNNQGASLTYSVHFADVNTGWAVGDYSWQTTNGGTVWDLHFVGQHGLRSVFSINSSTAWIAASNGYIFKTTDGGSTWTRQLTSTYRDLYAVQFIDADNGWVVGDDGTILHISGSPTSVWENRSTKAPSDFTLSQNYPNPFNPTTTIEYYLPRDSHIILSIYNITGQRVQLLKDGFQSAGMYSVMWNATGMPSGIYFCTLNSGEFVQTKKILLLK